MPGLWNQKKMKHSYHLFNLFLNKKRDGLSRDELITKLNRAKIGIGIHYRSIPEHTIYKKMFSWKVDDFPNAKKIGRETISLPLSPSLNNRQVYNVINTINKLIK